MEGNMKNLFSPDVDLSTVDNLVSGTLIPSKVWPVTVTGTGIVKRGTLLTREAGETSYKPYEEGDEIRAILLMDFDTEDTDETEAPVAFGGEFNQRKIEEVMGITLDPEAILDAAEDKEIYIAKMNPAPETF
jgi:hypothetical protein